MFCDSNARSLFLYLEVPAMKTSLISLWKDERGFLVSMELVLIATILVIGLVAGLACLQNAIVQEFNDLSWAITSLNQSYRTNAYYGCKGAFSGGSAFYGNNWNRGYAGAAYSYGGYGNGYGYGSSTGYGYGAGYAQGQSRAKVLYNDYGADVLGPCIDATGTGAAAGSAVGGTATNDASTKSTVPATSVPAVGAPANGAPVNCPPAAGPMIVPQGPGVELPCNGCNPGDAPAVLTPQPEAAPKSAPADQLLPSPPKHESK